MKNRFLQINGIYVWAVVVFLGINAVAWGVWLGVSKSRHSKSLAYTDADHELSMQFADQLFVAINPYSPENAYMPVRLKEILGWVLTESQARRLDIVRSKSFAVTSAGVSEKTLIAASYIDGMPCLAIIGPRLFGAIRDNAGRIPVITQEWKNYFALEMAQEALHFENRGMLKRELSSIPKEEMIQEELRVWMHMGKFIIGPLRDEHQPVSARDVHTDDIMKECEYQLPCERLRNYLMK